MTSKILLLLFSAFFATGTSSDMEKSENDEMQRDLLIGEFTREDLEKKPHSRWFNRGYRKYEPSKDALETIKNNISDYEIVYLMGSWCRDSRREIPKFYRLLDEAGYETNRISGFAVDFFKETPNHLEKELNVTMVPTIIFYKDGKEVNRFVEFPVKSLEEDLAEIVSQQDYKNSYADF